MKPAIKRIAIAITADPIPMTIQGFGESSFSGRPFLLYLIIGDFKIRGLLPLLTAPDLPLLSWALEAGLLLRISAVAGS